MTTPTPTPGDPWICQDWGLVLSCLAGASALQHPQRDPAASRAKIPSCPGPFGLLRHRGIPGTDTRPRAPPFPNGMGSPERMCARVEKALSSLPFALVPHAPFRSCANNSRDALTSSHTTNITQSRAPGSCPTACSFPGHGTAPARSLSPSRRCSSEEWPVPARPPPPPPPPVPNRNRVSD